MPYPDLILHNAAIHTAAGTPSPDAVAINAGKIAAVGRFADVARLIAPATVVLDCGGRTLIPGIVDAHCHLLAMAARAGQIDCRPAAAPSVPAIVAALRDAISGDTDAGAAPRWLRGYGYDDSPIGLGRHLTRHDLDAASTTRPVRVEHRSGHACVLNTPGLAAAGINRSTPTPPGAVIQRAADGEPTGLLLEMSAWLSERIASRKSPELKPLANRLLAYGITAVTDAGPANGIATLHSFTDQTSAADFPLRITMMAGWPQLDEITRLGLRYGQTIPGARVTIGHAKIMLTASSGNLHPHPARLTAMVTEAHQRGYPVAIHAVERDAIVAAAIALMDAGAIPNAPDRIEHCAECPPDVIDLLAQSGARAVPNPGFLHYDGARYRATVPPELLPQLYPVASLLAAGIPVALGSDAPVVEANPWAGIAAAVSRRSADGANLGGLPVESVQTALALHTAGARIAAGQTADLALVEPPPIAAPPECLPDVRSALTIINGQIAWRNGI